jgi:MFS family permease
MSLFISPLVGLSNQYLGTRPSLVIGSFLVFLSMLGASFATQVWQLFLSQGVCFGFGLGFLYLTSSPILGQWFSKKRSLSLGIASSGAGFGGLAYNLGAGAGVESLGVPWTYRTLAFTTLVVNLVCSLLLKDRNSIVKPTQRAFSIRELGHISILLLIAWGTFTELGYIVLLYSLPNYAQSIGLSAQQGSIVGAVLNLGLAFGRPLVGWLSDTFGRIDIATSKHSANTISKGKGLTNDTVMTALCGVFVLAIWVPAQSYAVLIIFALLSGAVCGTFWGTAVSVTAEVVGVKRLPASFTMVVFPLVLPTVFAEPIALRRCLAVVRCA